MVTKLPSMVDMALTKDEQVEMMTPSLPRYPYGLCISLCEDELEKLGISKEDVESGDMIHFQALAKATSVTRCDTDNGETCRAEFQIMFMSAEDEDNEGRMDTVSKLYR